MKRSVRLSPLLLLPALAACSNEPAPDAAAPAIGRTGGAIVNGQTETGYPAVGALTARYGTQYGGSFCTGTLIDPRWVLTAAHCVVGEDTSAATTRFYLGPDARPTASGAAPSTGTFHEVDRLIPHPGYNDQRLENDIALVQLRNPVQGVAPLPYHTAGLSSFVGSDVFYVGFGVTDGINERGAGLKRSTTMGLEAVYTKTFLSAYNGSGTCFGDSGGPAFLTINGVEKIVGLTSAGAPCSGYNCDPCKTDSINVRADAYDDWIRQQMGAPPPNCNNDASLCTCEAACQSDGRCDNAVCQVGSCRESYDCVVECGQDADCQQACFDAATPEGYAQLEAMFNCFQDKCGDLDGDAFQTCASNRCGAEINTCFPPEPIPTGDDDCETVYDCMSGCPDTNAQSCLEQCFFGGTETAQTQLNAMFDCFESECGNTSGSAFQTCAQDKCGGEINQCFGSAEPCDLTGGDCPSGEACWPTTSGSTACFPTAGIAPGEACDPGSDQLECRDGDACVGVSESEGYCDGFCRADSDCAGGETCNLSATGIRGVGLCEAEGESCVDADEDGVCAGDDCNDQAAGVKPGASEVCGDGIDNDCSGAADEGCPGGGDPANPDDGDPANPDPTDPGQNSGGTTTPGTNLGGTSSGCSGGEGSSGAALLGLLGALFALRLRRSSRAA